MNLKDVANYGYYVLPAEAFAPEADGTPPSIVVELDDLKNPTFPGCRELPREVVANVWNDFVLYFGTTGMPFVHADAKKKPSGVPEREKVCREAQQRRSAAGAGANDTAETGNAEEPVSQ